MDKQKINEWGWEKVLNSAEAVQDRVLKNIFASRRDEVSGEWGRWHTKDICDLYFLPNVILVIMSRRTRCVA
jgi:hypothetical protein